MEKIVVSAKYKGDTKAFTHGESYLVSVSQQADGAVLVVNLKATGDYYFSQAPKEEYASIVSFLMQWDEITSYPSLLISEGRSL